MPIPGGASLQYKQMATLLLSLGIAAGVAAPSMIAAARPEPAPCTFQLGFRALHDLIPDIVGDCVDGEYHNPDNGDGLQDTTKGLLVWRKSDNWTAFTNGSTTWINGPFGLQSRPNDQRFDWEAAAPPPARPTATPVPKPTSAPPTATPFPTATPAPTEPPNANGNDAPD
jgi:hypothetical protein